MSPQVLKKPRNARIMELYDEGATWEAIAESLEAEDFGKVTRQNVGRIIHKELERMMEQSLRDMVNNQAKDGGLWFDSTTVSEAYLQQELQKLHDLVEQFLGTAVA